MVTKTTAAKTDAVVDEVAASTDVAVIPSPQDAQALIASLQSGGAANVFTTVQGDDFDSRLTVFAALTDAEPVANHLGTVFNLKDVVSQVITIKDQEASARAGQDVYVDVPRTVLIADDGKAFAAISNNILKSLETLFAVLGEPHTWPRPLPVMVAQEGSGVRRYFTIKAVR